MTPAATITFSSRLRRIRSRRVVLWRLIVTELKVKYEGSSLGYLWSVLEPLLMAGIYYFVFALLRNRLDPAPYIVFLLSGILPWQWVTGVIGGSTKALRGNSRLIKKVDLPREIFPLAVVAEKGLEFAFSLPVLIAFVAIFQVAPSWFLLTFPLAVAMQLTFLVGLAFFLATLSTIARDLDRVVKPLQRAMFYLSPILYPITILLEKDLPRAVKFVYQLNPFVGILDLYRAVWFPEYFRGWDVVLASALGCLLVLLVGWRTFTRLERRVLKEL